MGTFLVGGVSRPAAYVADQIHLVWVEDATKDFFRPTDVGVPRSLQEKFSAKAYLYCEAAALRVLLTLSESNTDYQELVHEFENLIFPPASTSDTITKVEAVKSAMSSLQQFFDEKKELSWCQHWLQGIGHNEDNPGRLMKLAYLFGRNTQSLRELLKEIGPPRS